MNSPKGNDKGVVLIVVLWILLFLSLIAWGLGRRSSLEASLVEVYRGKLRSYAAACAGVNQVLDLMQRSSSTKDTLYAAGVAIDPTKTPESLFSRIDIGSNGYATVQWQATNFNAGDDKPHWEYGIQDEEGRINLNAIGQSNYQILSALLQLQGLSQGQGDKLALAIIGYTGMSVQPGDKGAKNRPYQNILELLEIDGMTKDIFNKIKDDVTVYGDAQNGLWINTDTANDDVIQAVANAAARLNPSINAGDIITQAYTIRDGADGVSFTADDGVGSITSVNDPNWPVVLQEGTSHYYRLRVVGMDKASSARTVLEVVVHSLPGAPPEIIGWQRD